jgi:4-hydroxy-2-oxoglutarate aldolase
LLYNVTMFTGVNLLPDAVERLATHGNIVGMKESGNDMAQLAEYVARTPDDFTVLAGSASTYFQALCAGCDGGVLALASLLPEACVHLRTLVIERRIEEARSLHRRMLPLARSVGTGFGVPGLKAALTLIGYDGGLVRPPLRPVSPDIIHTIRAQIDALGDLVTRFDVSGARSPEPVAQT